MYFRKLFCGPRKPTPSISQPYNVKSFLHITVDPVSGELNGLPEYLQRLLASTPIYEYETKDVLNQRILDIISVYNSFEKETASATENGKHQEAAAGTQNDTLEDLEKEINGTDGLMNNAVISEKNKKMTFREFEVEIQKRCREGRMSDFYIEKKNELLGEGITGAVVLGKCLTTNGTVAIKKYDLTRKIFNFNYILEEIDTFKLTRGHPNFLQCMSTAYLPYSQIVVLASEYMDGGDLAFVLEMTKSALPENAIAYVSREMLTALDFLHQHKIIHRDIKSDNILLNSKGEVKLGDFGCVGTINDRRIFRTTAIGTLYWLAPELAQNHRSRRTKEGSPRAYNSKVDIWSLGIVVYEMIFRKPPYFDDDEDQISIMFKIMKGRPDYDLQLISSELQEFMDPMLSRDPNNRPEAAELRKHSFMDKACSPEKWTAILDDIYQ